MTINYSTLTGAKNVEGSIRNWVNRGDIPATVILQEAQATIYETLRVREMQRIDTAFTFPADDWKAALPEDFLDPISFTPYGWGRELLYVHEQALGDVTDEDGNLFKDTTPSQWTVFGTEAQLNIQVGKDFRGRLRYYGRPEFLSATNQTNFLTNRYPRLLRIACMAMAYEHMKDKPQADDYLVQLVELIKLANRTNEMYRRSQYVPAD